jgi:hypothetical protein
MEWTKLKCLAEELPVRPMSSDCTCGDAFHGHTRAIVFEDGWLVECLHCGARWCEFRLTRPKAGSIVMAE